MNFISATYVVLVDTVQNMVYDMKPHNYIVKIGMNIHPLFSLPWTAEVPTMYIPDVWGDWIDCGMRLNSYLKKYSLLLFNNCLECFLIIIFLSENSMAFECCFFIELSHSKHVICAVSVLSLQEANYLDYPYHEWASFFSRSCKQPRFLF